MNRASRLGALGILWAGLAFGQEPSPPAGAVPAADAGPAVFDLDGGAPNAPRSWVSADYLLWNVRSAHLPFPLVTSGSVADQVPGALGQPGTRVLYGGSNAGSDLFSGGRLAAGAWLTPGRELGVEAGGFLLERRSAGFQARSDDAGSPLLGRPFFNVLEGGENTFIDSIPGSVAGATSVSSSLRLWGWEANLATQRSLPGGSADLLFGYRTLDLRVNLRIADRLTP